jgi:hypothetical protein
VIHAVIGHGHCFFIVFIVPQEFRRCKMAFRLFQVGSSNILTGVDDLDFPLGEKLT